MLRIITPARMRAAEIAYMQQSGTPSIVLMERAAEALAEAILSRTDGGVVLLCGPGNNGGDGYAAARLLHARRRAVEVWSLCDPESLKGDARINMEKCRALSIDVRYIRVLPKAPPEGTALLVDALFGTGLHAPLAGMYAEAARYMNASPLPVLAVDMPSGTKELCVMADTTVTFHRMKPCHMLFPGRRCAGEVIVADIGMPDTHWPDDFTCLEASDVSRMLAPRPLDAHKGTSGHVLCIAGSFGMAGAASLCANGALRTGAGLVTVLCPKDTVPMVQTLAPCAMCRGPEQLCDAIQRVDSIAVGPGLAADALGEADVSMIIGSGKPQVWDAEALNWLAAHGGKLPECAVMTPHPGEAARLLAVDTKAVTDDPVQAAHDLFYRYGAVVLLKGATTVIVGEGVQALDISGSPGMATGGCGDVLTGIIASLLAGGMMPFDAAGLGALLHGRAGETAAARRGVRSMIAMDLLDALRID